MGEIMATTYAPSIYQQRILDFVKDPNGGNAIVQARAGSGKTSTLMMIDSLLASLSKSRVLIAFNKSIATELVNRGANGRTFHSLGFGAVRRFAAAKGIRRINMDARKVANIIQATYPNAHIDGYSSALERLVSLAKNHAIRPNVTNDALISLITHFDVEWEDDRITDADMCDYTRTILRANNADLSTLDFDDQLYFVELYNLRMEQFDFVLVDESQDTNPLRRALVRRLMHRNSRLIAVGDDKQAIYGFTGASHDSMDLIARDYSCAVLPLSICYRCPSSVIQLAQSIVPDIEARPNAPEGTVTYAKSWKRSDFLPTDLIICRNTAPLVQTAYKLISARIPCKVMGRDIGRGLTTLIRKLSRRNETLESLYPRLETYRDTETAKALAKKQEGKAQSISDKVDSILSLIDSMTQDDVEMGIPRLLNIIDSIFSDNGPQVTTLATVHKAKGMEAQRVFILDSFLMPSKFARQEWQIAQEHNLRYVAITRALDTLVFVDSETLTD
jgi:superfamily I DNA/RNA helicase